jgi:hypothetical protein
MLPPFFDDSGDASHDPPEVPDVISQEDLPRCQKLNGSSLSVVPGNIEPGAFCEANCVTITDGAREAVYVPLRSERTPFGHFHETPQCQLEELTKLSLAGPLKVAAMEGGGIQQGPVLISLDHLVLIDRSHLKIVLDLLSRMVEDYPMTPRNCSFPLTLDPSGLTQLNSGS